MKFIDTINKLFSKFDCEIISKTTLDKLIYSASYNQSINIDKKHFRHDPFDDQHFLIKNPSPVIFDVGAYIGKITEKYAVLFEDSTIFAFEPTPSAFSRLRQRTKKLSNVKIFNVAISNYNKKCKFNLNKFSPANSLLDTAITANKTWGDNLIDTEKSIIVTSCTIDQFCDDYEIDTIDILKLDVQGGELAALSGANNMLKRERVHLVYTEIIFADTYVNQFTLTEILHHLEKFNFQLFNFYNFKSLNRQLVQADLILANKGLLKNL